MTDIVCIQLWGGTEKIVYFRTVSIWETLKKSTTRRYYLFSGESKQITSHTQLAHTFMLFGYTNLIRDWNGWNLTLS